MQTESTSRVKGNLPDDLPEDPGNRYLLQSMNEGTWKTGRGIESIAEHQELVKARVWGTYDNSEFTK